MSIEDSNTVDFVVHEASGHVILIMVEGRAWDGSDDRIFELQEKINSYATFACDGHLLELYPELVGKPVRIELRCVTSPDPKTTKFLETVSEKLQEVGLRFSVQQLRGHPSG